MRRAPARMKVCDLALFSPSSSSGVKTYISSKIDYVRERPDIEHVVIVPGRLGPPQHRRPHEGDAWSAACRRPTQASAVGLNLRADREADRPRGARHHRAELPVHARVGGLPGDAAPADADRRRLPHRRPRLRAALGPARREDGRVGDRADRGVLRGAHLPPLHPDDSAQRSDGRSGRPPRGPSDAVPAVRGRSGDVHPRAARPRLPATVRHHARAEGDLLRGAPQSGKGTRRPVRRLRATAAARTSS